MELTKRFRNRVILVGIFMLIFVLLAFGMFTVCSNYADTGLSNDIANAGEAILALFAFLFFIIVCCFSRNGNFLLLALPKIFDTIHYVLPIGYIVAWAVFYSGLPILSVFVAFAIFVVYSIAVFIYCFVYAKKLSQVSIMGNIRNNHIRPNDVQRQKFESFCAKRLDILSFSLMCVLIVFNIRSGNDIVLIGLIVCALVGILTVILPMYKYIYTSRKVRYTVLVAQLLLFCLFATLSILMYYGVIKLPRYPEMSFNEIKVLGLVWLFSFGNTLLYPRTALSHTVKFQALLNDQPEIYEQGYNDVLL